VESLKTTFTKQQKANRSAYCGATESERTTRTKQSRTANSSE